MNMMSLQNQSCFCNVLVASVGTASEHYLLYFFLLHLSDGCYIVRLMGTSNQWFKAAKINGNLSVIFTALICLHRNKLILSSLSLHKSAHQIICRENRTGRTKLCPHIGNRYSVLYLQLQCTRTCVFINFSQSAFHRIAAQHFQNHILGTAPRLQLSNEIYTNNLRHFQPHRHPRHSCCNIHSTYTNTHHSNGTAVRRVAVATHRQLSGSAKPCNMYSMTDAISRSGYINSVFFCNRLQINMIIRCFIIQVQQIVIQVTHACFYLCPIQANLLKGQIRHNCVNIMG